MHTTEYHRGIKLITTCLEAKQKNKLHFWCNFILVNDSNNWSSNKFTKMRGNRIGPSVPQRTGNTQFFYSIDTDTLLDLIGCIIKVVTVMDGAFLGITNHAQILSLRSRILGIWSPENWSIKLKFHKWKLYYKLE